MLFLAVVLLGLISFARLPIDLLPDGRCTRLVTTRADSLSSDVQMQQLERLKTAQQVAFARTRLASLAQDPQVDDELRKLAKEVLSRP